MENDCSFIHYLKNHVDGLEHLIEQYNQYDAGYFSSDNSLRIKCLAGCGACCNTPSINIEASVFEMLPMAIEIFEEGEAEDVYTKLKSMNDDDAICLIYHPLSEDKNKGFCNRHKTRPIICRMFAGGCHTDKNGKKSLVLCKQLHRQLEENEDINELTNDLPIIEEFATTLRDNNYQLTSPLYSINEALKLALEYVLMHYEFYEEENTEGK